MHQIPPDQKPAKTPRITDYAIGKIIGQGSYAVVKQGFNKRTRQKVAIKIYEKINLKNPKRNSCVLKEIQLMKKLNHENIVQLYDSIDTMDQLYLIMELVQGKSLYSFVQNKKGQRLQEKEAASFMKSILKGIEYCHINNVAHRDIKLENILLNEASEIKIIDFGFSVTTQKNEKLKTFCGTPSYMAPEIVNRTDYFGPPADVWSLGVLFYVLLCGSFPFTGVNVRELFKNISKGSLSFPFYVSKDAKTTISRMLRINPSQRPTITQVNHTFLYYSYLKRLIFKSLVITRI